METNKTPTQAYLKVTFGIYSASQLCSPQEEEAERQQECTNLLLVSMQT